jgi:hypothetical protein
VSINRSSFWTQFAKQAAKDVAAAAPAFYCESRSGALIATRDVAEMNVGDGSKWGTSYVYVKKISAGGSPRIVAKPLVLGALLNAVLGSDTASGGSDPYTHTIVPADTIPWHTFWSRVDSKYEKFDNVKVTELLIEGSPDDGYLFITPTLGFAAKPSTVTAPADASTEALEFFWNQGCGYWCMDGDYENILTTPKATDQTSANALANALQAVLAAHYANVITPHHAAADTDAHVATLAGIPAATTEGTCATLATGIKASLNAHRSVAGVHFDDDTGHEVTSANATDLATSLVLLNECRSDYLGHIGVVGSVKNFSIKISRGATEWQGEDIVNYDFPEGRGRIEASYTVLVEDFQRYYKLMYGSKAPAAGTEVGVDIYEGNFYCKFATTEGGKERSLAVTIPTLRFTDPGIVEPDADGAPPEGVIAGVAGGTAPVITCVVTNSRATAY